MNKTELELEAEKYRLSTANKMAIEKTAYAAGATSKYVEKQKLEFAIRQLRECKKGAFNTVENKVKELEQQLEKL